MSRGIVQLFALDQTYPVLASQAQPRYRYVCPECAEPVFVRKGPHRQAHYYHKDRSLACRQNQKTLEHLQAQLSLFKALQSEEAHLEYRFPSIQRIADVAWLSHKIVFEIQCSPISAEEVLARTADYQSIGFQVVWILHDKRFNKRKLCQAEHVLQSKTCYYTNYSKNGLGIFYDQFEVCRGAYRAFKGPPLPISLCDPIYSPHLHFKGDLKDQLKGRDPPVWQKPPRKILHVKQLYMVCLDALIKALIVFLCIA